MGSENLIGHRNVEKQFKFVKRKSSGFKSGRLEIAMELQI